MIKFKYKMRNISIVLLVFGFVLKGGIAFADEQIIQGGESTALQYIPTAVRIDAGLNGYGGAILWDVNNTTTVVLGYEGQAVRWEKNMTTQGNKYRIDDVKSKNAYLHVQIHPWGEQINSLAKSFYLVTGAGYLNRTDYLSLDSNNSKAIMNYNHTFSPYMGVGMSNLISAHWEIFGEFGTYYVNRPLIKDATGTNNDKYEWLPNAKLGLVYQF